MPHSDREGGKNLSPARGRQLPSGLLRVVVTGSPLQIPKRIHFLGEAEATLQPRTDPWLVSRCLRTRGTDGYERQASLRQILSASEAWVIPFVTLLAGEYVGEI